MRLSLKTKFTLATSLLVLAVVTVVSGLYLGAADAPDPAPGRRPRPLRRAAGLSRLPERARGRRRNAATPPLPRSPTDMRDYVRAHARQQQHSEFADRIGRWLFRRPSTKSPSAMTMAPCWSPATPPCAARRSPARPPRRVSGARRILQQLRTLYGPPQTYEYSLPFQSGLRAVRRYSHRPFLLADSRRNFSRPEFGRLLGAGLGPALHFARVRRQPDSLAPIGRISAAAGPHFRRGIRHRAGRRARRRTRRRQHENHRHRKAATRRARNFQHPARKSRPGDERPRRRPASFQRRRAAPSGQPLGRKISRRTLRRSARKARQRDFSRRGIPLRDALGIEGDQIESRRRTRNDTRWSAAARSGSA